MYTTEIMRERARELRLAGRTTRDAGSGLRRARALAARMHHGR